MKELQELHDRIDNVRRNIAESGSEFEDQESNAAWRAVAQVSISHLADLGNIAADIAAYKPSTEITQQEYDDIQALSDIGKRNGVLGDGLDHDLVKASQEVQRLIMLRIGSRHWVQKHVNQ